MAEDEILSEELDRAARNLEERFRHLQVASIKIERSQWLAMPIEVQQVIPPWLPVLLEKYRLARGRLECREPGVSYRREFQFYEPEQFALYLEPGTTLSTMLPYGYVPFADETDGNAWIMKWKDGQASTIFLLDHSAWGGGEPTEEFGRIFASSNLALMLSSMGVCSAYEGTDSPQSRLWYEKE
jgi:hypothetical protein